MKIWLIIFFNFLLQPVLLLHIRSSPSPNDKIGSKLSDLNDLASQEIGGVGRFTDADSLNAYLTSGMAEELQGLQQIEELSLSQIQFTSDICSASLSSQQKQATQGKLNKLLELIQSLEDQSRSFGAGQQSKSWVSNIQRLKQYLRKLERSFDKKCEVLYFMNVSAPNWLPGANQTIERIFSSYVQAIQTQGAIICPESAPFAFQGAITCFNCLPSTPIFDFTAQKCVTCPSGLVFSRHQCMCPEGQYFDAVNQFCVVKDQNFNPEIGRIENNVQVVTARAVQPIMRDPITVIPEHTRPNGVAKSALGRTIVLDWRENVLGSVPCPDSTPFYTSGDNPCIACPEYFDWRSKKCATCPPNTELKSNKCV